MAISSVGSNARPGVCTSTTRPTAPFEGQLIYETDTNRVLIWEGVAWVMIADTDSPPGLQLIKSQNVGTSVASTTISDVFSSEFDNYRIIFSGGNSSLDSYSIKMRMNNSTGNSYKTQAVYAAYGGTNSTSHVVGVSWFYVGYTNNDSASVAWIDLSNPFLANRPTSFSSSSSGDTYAWIISTGIDNSNASNTGFILDYDGTTMTGGVIRVYGYRN